MYLRLISAVILVLFISRANGQVPDPVEHYKSAVTLAGKGKKDAALEALDKAAAAGFRGLTQVRNATAFDSLRDDPRFAKVLIAVRRNIFPCEEGAKYGDFDFWIGNWDVFDASNQKVGRNRITPMENGCVLQELWTDMNGVTGRSLNYYDPNKDKWRQHWVSATGLLVDIEGNLVDGSMILSGQVYYPNTGQQAGFRGTWTLLKDGRVRQFFEQHDPQANTWKPWFEGFYVRQTD